MITTGSRPAPGDATAARAADEHAVRPKDQLRQRRRDRPAGQDRARRRGDATGRGSTTSRRP